MEHTNEDDSTISVITGIDRSYSEVDVGSSNRKDGESMYSSEDFDDQSTTGEKSAEDEVCFMYNNKLMYLYPLGVQGSLFCTRSIDA